MRVHTCPHPCPYLHVPTPVHWLPRWLWFHPLLGGELGGVGDAGGSLLPRGALSSLTPEDIVTWLLLVFSHEPWGSDLARAEDFGLPITVRGEGLCGRI